MLNYKEIEVLVTQEVLLNQKLLLNWTLLNRKSTVIPCKKKICSRPKLAAKQDFLKVCQEISSPTPIAMTIIGQVISLPGLFGKISIAFWRIIYVELRCFTRWCGQRWNMWAQMSKNCQHHSCPIWSWPGKVCHSSSTTMPSLAQPKIMWSRIMLRGTHNLIIYLLI